MAHARLLRRWSAGVLVSCCLAALAAMILSLDVAVTAPTAYAQPSPTPSMTTEPTCVPPVCGGPTSPPPVSPSPSLSVEPSPSPTTASPPPSPTPSRTSARPVVTRTTRAPETQGPAPTFSEVPVGAPSGSESPSPSESPVAVDTDEIGNTDGKLRTIAILVIVLVVLLGVGGSVGLYLTREPKDA